LKKPEDAYAEGRACFHNQDDTNPFDPKTDFELWEAWYDGYGDEQRRESESRIQNVRMRSSYFNYDV